MYFFFFIKVSPLSTAPVFFFLQASRSPQQHSATAYKALHPQYLLIPSYPNPILSVILVVFRELPALILIAIAACIHHWFETLKSMVVHYREWIFIAHKHTHTHTHTCTHMHTVKQRTTPCFTASRHMPLPGCRICFVERCCHSWLPIFTLSDGKGEINCAKLKRHIILYDKKEFIKEKRRTIVLIKSSPFSHPACRGIPRTPPHS